MECVIKVLDEVNVKLCGVQRGHLDVIMSKIELMVKGARHTAAYKVGSWNGKKPQLNKYGETFTFMLPKILPILEGFGYTFRLDDYRTDVELPTGYIDESFIPGITLRTVQVDAVNTVIDKKKGILDICTAGGKTIISAAIAKYYDEQSLIIVPSNYLLSQTYDDFKMVGLDAGRVCGQHKEWDHKHIIATYQTLKNYKDKINRNTMVVQADEVHQYLSEGGVVDGLLTDQLKHAKVRIGLTGTVPKDKQQREVIHTRIGNDTIFMYKPEEGINDGYLSTLEISQHPVKHKIMVESDWTCEFKYYNRNEERLIAIADWIDNLDEQKLLVITHPEAGDYIAHKLGLDFIDKDTPEAYRTEYYKTMDIPGPYTLVASYGTVSTGVSMNSVQAVVLLDVGKTFSRVIQSIGRGLRLDGKNNHLKVYDVYASMIKEYKGKQHEYGFSLRHLKERRKIYKEYGYTHFIGSSILVED